MLIAVTGATGFVGRYIVNHLLESGHHCRCWYRTQSNREGFINDNIDWLEGELGNAGAVTSLIDGVDGVVHCGVSWIGSEYSKHGSVADFVQINVASSIALIEAAVHHVVKRFVYISSCAVHDVILDDRPLDEAHPKWPASAYGAHKAAVESFVHSFGRSDPSFQICALRPAGVYGLQQQFERGKWVQVVRDVMTGKAIASDAGGKEVHAADVAKAVSLLLSTDEPIAGQAYNCCDMYIAEQTVAQIAKEITRSKSEIQILNRGAKHQIDTNKIQALGMTFGGLALAGQYIEQLVERLG
jgi:nucleoside-diphosphate-sugar epimerase